MTSNTPNQPPAPFDLAELKRLVAASSDAGLTSPDRDRLEQILKSSREARSVYIAYMQLDAGLDWKIRGGQSVHGLLNVAKERTATAADSNHPSLLLTKGPSHRALGYMAAAATAASLAFILGSALWFSSGPRNVPVALEGRVLDGGEAENIVANSIDAVAHVVELSNDCRWFVENRGGKPAEVRPGDKIRLARGRLRMDFNCGATLTMKSPVALEVISAMRTRAVLGTLTAHVERGTEGFTVETPRTKVVDLGTDFGIDVSDQGSTDVIVFEGAVDVHSDGVEGLNAQQRLVAGEGLRVSGEGTASRIVSITDSQYSIAGALLGSQHRMPVISAVSDNIRRGESWHYYEIVHGGMREDAKAFVDRKDHEWNGVDASGIPSYLFGADYVKTFNDDKLNRDVEIRVTLDRPAILFVLHDNRAPVPDWLRDGFYDTGDDIGIDGGGYTRLEHRKITALGTGNSIDDTLSIWRRDVHNAGTVKLGAIRVGGEKHNMYGIAAVPIEVRRAPDDEPGSADRPSIAATPLSPGLAGHFSVEGKIERLDDADVYSFNWPGGPMEVVCNTSGFTTLDPVLSFYDSQEEIVGYSRSDRSRRSKSAITMNLAPGVYYAVVTGSDELGEVGLYDLKITPSSMPFGQPALVTPSFLLDAVPAVNSVTLTWSHLPAAKSFILERSTDAVTFEPRIITATTSAIDGDLESGAQYFYRLRAITDTAQLTSAVRPVRTRAAAVERVQAVGRTSQAILLEWDDVAGDVAYRIERAADGKRFEAIATVPHNSCGYRDENIAAGHQYHYRIVTLDPLGDSATSEPVRGSSGAAGFTAARLSDNRVKLTWDPNYSPGRLFIERAADASDGFKPIAKLDPQAHEYIDTKAPANGELRYRLVAAEDINDLQAVESDTIDTIRIPERVHRDYFALQFLGKIRIDKPGTFRFYLNSDDGSRFILNGSTLIENDGLHTAQVMWRSVKLPAGLHDFELQYFEHGGQTALDLMWSSDDVPKSKIPPDAFSSLRYRYYQGMWWYLPFNKTVAVSEIVTVRALAEANATGDSL